MTEPNKPPESTGDDALNISPAVNAAISRLAAWLQTPAGVKRLASVVGAVLAVALVSGGLLTISMASSGDLTSAPSAFGAFLTFAGVSMGAGAGVSMGDAGGSVSVFSLGTLFAAWAAVHFLTRWQAPAEQALDRAGRAMLTSIEAVAAATVLTLLTGFTSIGSSEAPLIEDASLSSRWFTTWLLTVVVVAIAGATGRRAARAPQPTVVTAVLREVVRLHAVWLTIFGPVVFVATAIALIREDTAIGILALPPLAGNLAAAGVGLGYFGALSATVSELGDETAWAWDIANGHGAWLFGVGLIAVIVAAVRVGMHRQRSSTPQWNRTWQLPTITLLVWILLTALLAGVRISASGFNESAMVGAAWWTSFTVTIAAAVISVAAEFAPAIAYSISPALAAALAGKPAVQHWLAGTTATPAATPTAPPADGGAAVPPAADTTPTASEPAPTAEPRNVPPPAGAYPAGAATPAAGPTDTEATAEVPQPYTAEGFAADDGSESTQEIPALDTEATQVFASAPPGETVTQPAFEGSPLPPPSSMSRRSKRRTLLIVGLLGGLAILIAGFFIAVSIINSQRGPDEVVDEYLALLADGRGDEATELVDPGIANDERAMLTTDAMKEASALPKVSNVTVDDRSGDSAEVTATLSIDGERFEHTFTVDAGDKEFGFLDTWELKDPLLVPVTISSNVDGNVLVGEEQVELADDEGDGYTDTLHSRQLMAYPGIYTVTTPESEYMSTPDEDLVVRPDSDEATVELTSEPSDKLSETVLSKVHERVEQCATPPTNMDEICPSAVQDTDLAELKATTLPKGLDSIDLDSFDSQEATITIRPNPTEFDDEPDSREIDFSLSGTIAFEDGKPVVEFDDGYW